VPRICSNEVDELQIKSKLTIKSKKQEVKNKNSETRKNYLPASREALSYILPKKTHKLRQKNFNSFWRLI